VRGAYDGCLPGDSRIVCQSPFAHPELDHAIQHTAVNIQAAAKFIEIERRVSLLDCMQYFP